MNAKKGVDAMHMCRICAVDVANDTTTHLLIESNQITDSGEKFISCLGIQLMMEGFPDLVCDLCNSQLNTFHAFKRKAKLTSKGFEKMLHQQLKQHDEDEEAEKGDLLTSTDMEFQVDDAINTKNTDQPLEVEYIIDSNKEREVAKKESLTLVTSPANGDEDEYTVEYLEPEYMSTFEDEITQNENEHDDENDDVNESEHDDEDDDEDDIDIDDDDMEQGEGQTSKPSSKNQAKRTYPYKCTKCNKRFVYKEVYEAHIRMHKGLPGFSCPHCPKTFNEKANFDYHMQDHTNYRPAKCHLCEKSFKNKQDLASHIRCHKDIRKYMCDVCGKRFRSQSHMTYHRYAHFEARNFACDQCTQKFKSPHILRTHRNTVHSNVFRYECEQCGRKFKRDHHLVAHRRTHNKTPGNRKPRKKKTDKDENTQSFEMVEMIKEEELDLHFEDEEYEAEFITD